MVTTWKEGHRVWRNGAVLGRLGGTPAAHVPLVWEAHCLPAITTADLPHRLLPALTPACTAFPATILPRRLLVIYMVGKDGGLLPTDW